MLPVISATIKRKMRFAGRIAGEVHLVRPAFGLKPADLEDK